MREERLWAPWRLPYIKGDDQSAAGAAKKLELLPGGDAECFLCRAVADDADRDNWVVERTERTVSILNRYPYNNGHVLIAPRLHKGRLDELTIEEHIACALAVAEMVDVLERTMQPQGFNVGLNLGRVAGAGLPGHLHWHIVPRWSGDTNFMSVVAATKVIPQSLDALWEILTEALRQAP